MFFLNSERKDDLALRIPRVKLNNTIIKKRVVRAFLETIIDRNVTRNVTKNLVGVFRTLTFIMEQFSEKTNIF